MTRPPLDSWADLTLGDLFYAYRKAKVDCHYERSMYVAERFAVFESRLSENLADLFERIRESGVGTILHEDVGSRTVIPKRIITEDKARVKNHCYFSDGERAFSRLKSTHILQPGFRTIGDFSVHTHVISALWINLVGHLYDAELSKNAYGSRLRRYSRNNRDDKASRRPYHLQALGSFEPYFEPYKSWRDNGLRAIERAIDAKQSVSAVTLDFTAYYHRINPHFISDPAFCQAIGVSLNQWAFDFTSEIANFMESWSSETNRHHGIDDDRLGVPIGISASRVIANALLIEFDRKIENALSPLYYGRYVDDVFLVLSDSGRVQDADELWDNIANALDGLLRVESTTIKVELPGEYKRNTELYLQKEKQRAFFLSGDAGKDMLSALAVQIRSVSSERRLMPSPDELDSAASAKVLATADHGEEADSLRRADGLSVRRLGWALQLRSVEILSRDLKPDSWVQSRRRFYKFAMDHVLRPDRIFEQLDYVPRLVGLAIDQGDWSDAARLVRTTRNALDDLRRASGGKRHTLNGTAEVSNEGADRLWDTLETRFEKMCREAILRSVPWDRETNNPQPLTPKALKLCDSLGIGFNSDQILARALRLRESDLARISYKDHLRLYASRARLRESDESDLESAYSYSKDLREFLAKTWRKAKGSEVRRVNDVANRQSFPASSIIPFLVPTRAYTGREVSLFLPDDCVFGDPDAATVELAQILRAIRGTWSFVLNGMDLSAAPTSPASPAPRTPRRAVLSDSDAPGIVRLGVSSLETGLGSWSLGAAGTPDVSVARWKRVCDIVNLAVKADPRPTHLLLPELALPEAWIMTVADMLRQSGISLIAGLDYEVLSNKEIRSNVVISLSDSRLGYPSMVEIRQPKGEAAPAEEEDLLRGFDRSWRKDATPKPLYCHNGFWFGILVCSELQNMAHRAHFQGKVDCLMVLSWNKDLETFSALVESASLDVHAHIALVNNRTFGDSRVRTPAKEQFNRDLCRIKGGLNEHLVVVEVAVAPLRAQQSRAHRWPRPTDLFKPAPEGFKISDERKVLPS